MGQIVSLLFFYKDGFGIKYLTKVDMRLNKENKSTVFHFVGLFDVEVFSFLKKN